MDAAHLPNLAEAIGPFLARLPREHQPLLVAIAERWAAQRYRGWATDPVNAAHVCQLLACADREEQIADRIEALHPEAAAIQRDILAQHPELEEINRTIFAGRPLAQQFAIQARGERLGAATWRAFARDATDDRVRAVFLVCAALEEESALVLEGILTALA